jgi:hypothetical protein
MAINNGKVGMLAGLGMASLFLTDAGREVRKRARTLLARVPDTNHALAARVCAELDSKVEHGKGIQVFADDNCVILRGQALTDELPAVLETVRSIGRVREVENRLELLDSPGNVLALQT